MHWICARPRSLAAWCWITWFLVLYTLAHASSRRVVVDLKSSWNATSLLHEAAEFFGQEDPNGYFTFTQLWRESRGETCWSRLQNVMGSMASDQMYQMSMVALASRQYSPKLETFRQLSGDKQDACCWAVVNDKTIVTDPHAVGDVIEKSFMSDAKSQILDIDHVYPGSRGNTVVVALYGPIDSKCSEDMHDAIVASAEKRKNVTYIWRPIPYRKEVCLDTSSCSSLGAGDSLTIPGYGVELAIKNMEYNARDDSSSTSRDSKSNESETTNIEKLEISVSDFSKIGVQTVEKVLRADDWLEMLQEVTQNFPSMVDTISTVEYSDKTYVGLKKLSSYVMSGAQIMQINGMGVDLQDMSWHELLETLRHESDFVTKLHNLGVPSSSVGKLYKLRSNDDRNVQGEFRLDFQPTESVFWMNNLEKDEEFRGLPRGLQHMLQPSFFGQAPAIRRNVLTAFLVVDVGSRGGVMALSTAFGLASQGLPVRIGVVPVVKRSAEDDVARKLTDVFVILGLHGDGRLAVEFFAQAAARVADKDWQEASFPKTMKTSLWKLLKSRWSEISSHFDDIAFKKLDKYLEENTLADVENLKKETTGMMNNLGVESFPESGGVLLMNGVLHNIESTSMWHPVIVKAWQSETASIQKLIYEGQLSDASEDLLSDILMVHNALPGFNPRIIRKTNILGSYDLLDGAHRDIHFENVSDTLALLQSMNIQYFRDLSMVERTGEFPVTHWIIVSPSSKNGLSLIDAALMHGFPRSRMGIVVNPDVQDCSVSDVSDLEAFLLALSGGIIGKGTQADHFDILASIASMSPDASSVENLWKLLPEGVVASEDELMVLLQTFKTGPMFERHCVFTRNHVGLSIGDSGVLTNGRFLTSRWAGDISERDFMLLEQVASNEQYANENLFSILKDTVSEEVQNDLAALVSSVMVSHKPAKGQEASSGMNELFKRIGDEIKLKSTSKYDFSVAPLEIKAVFDPLSKESQQISAVLVYLKSWMHVNIEVALNPKLDYSDMPLKTYYRFVLPSISNIEELQSPRAIVPSLPLQDILTLGMDVPEMWLISPTHSQYDLDNIHLASLEPGENDLEASFRLDSVLVTGMCVDYSALESGKGSRIHPRGVQLNLGTPEEPTKFDTLVMSNLGYFQLKSSPGIWQLRLAEGRSSDVYGIKSVIGRSDHSLMKNAAYIKDNAAVTPVASFAGEHLLLLLSPNPGHMDDDVLSPASTGVVPSSGSDDDTIHVFTVASGHMYERLQKIMILSATKRSSRKMKFWFIDNYMSPQMKEFIPIMASLYGFEYEFVTYKWPSWLHKQTEKQRIIWAYKILFLDVLFPLGLKKVIFCDSDQVIRADLAELWDYDLKGAPYGYTPFCDNNKDMDGFRFWKQGFWQNHLKGKPYHISALYVIDLEKFRSMAAGDQLRVIYDRLSKDPNSLSNLDQDLPNFAQHEVPIASLPQEWLWCETWCGESTRPQAKTIDLCNNPLTKEPKLKSARRIIAEWPDLNQEVEELTTRVEGYLDGMVSEKELYDDSTRFHVSLLPMVEGSVKSSGSSDRTEL